MSFAGDYKLSAMRQLKEDESGFEMVPISEIDLNSLSDRSIDNIAQTIITITEDGKMIYHIPIPADAPADEIKNEVVTDLHDFRGLPHSCYIVGEDAHFNKW